MQKNNICKILDYWYMNDILNQEEHPYEDVKNYTILKQKAESTYKKTELEDYIDVAFAVTAEQLRSDVILKLIDDEVAKLNEIRFGEQLQLDEDEKKPNRYEINGKISLYVGEVERENCLMQLVKLLNPSADTESRPEKMDSRLSLGVFQIDANGGYIPESLSVSPVLWGISTLEKASSKTASSLNSKDYYGKIKSLDKKFTDDASAIPEIWNELKDEFQYAQTAAQLENPQEFIVKVNISCQSSDNTADSEPPRLSMSFYAEDLAYCRQMAENGTLTAKTADYILSACTEESSADSRTDLVTGTPQSLYEQFDEILDVNNTPIGKWPSPFSPALMQQAAINLETHCENSGEIFSVNGPPGTGKTTLLKEIIVNNIVERARKIYDFTENIANNDPDKLFEEMPFKSGDVKFNGKTAYAIYSNGWYRLKEQYDAINDYGIIVASCNNAAVENISKELPVDEFTSYCEKEKKNADYEKNTFLFSPIHNKSKMTMYAAVLNEGKIPKTLHNYKDGNKDKILHNDVYFSYYADTLLNGEKAAAQLLDDYDESKNDNRTYKHAWGLIAAPLGKHKNLKNFYESVLLPFINATQEFGIDKKAERHKKQLELFKNARKNFKNQLNKVLELQKQLDELQEAERQVHNNEKRIAEARAKLQQTDYNSLIAELNEKAAELSKKLSAYGGAEQIEGLCMKHRSELIQKKNELDDISLMMLFHTEQASKKRLFGFGNKKSKEHLAEAEKCQKRCNDLEEIIAETKKLVEDLESVSKTKETHEKTIKEIEKLKREFSELKKLAETNINSWNGERVNAVNTAFIADYLDKENKCCTTANTARMRVDNEYDRQREILFYQALQLNKYFVSASECLLENFKLLGQYWGFSKVRKVINGKFENPNFQKDDKIAFAPALYQSLLLLVPVISSTFASIGSMLRDVKEQDIIGTLIIDEAGQASPECAVGAIFRSKRAMIVGDPKQVEPVVTDDLKLIRDSYDDEILQPYKNSLVSVQTFADNLNKFGTVLSDIDDNDEPIDTWVGCPLVVHRRCISPMFDISNELSYKIMRNQTEPAKPQDEEKYIFSKSRWLAIDGNESGNKNHYVKAQGEEVAKLIIESFRKSDTAPSIYVISPFTSVVRGMRNTICAMAKMESDELYYRIFDWSKKCIGTVHKFQGKEAMEVFFLLGCDSTSLSAVKWVNKNIVNVAVTRAKHRIYIVGRYDGVWSNNPYLSTAYTIIDEQGNSPTAS